MNSANYPDYNYLIYPLCIFLLFFFLLFLFISVHSIMKLGNISTYIY